VERTAEALEEPKRLPAEAQGNQVERPLLGLILEVPEIELLDAFLRTATTALVFLFLLMMLLVS
jgi:hypothetical protein